MLSDNSQLIAQQQDKKQLLLYTKMPIELTQQFMYIISNNLYTCHIV